MSSYTTNLQLYKADPETDQNDTFNINTHIRQSFPVGFCHSFYDCLKTEKR